MKAWVFKWLFEELIPFKWFDGNKTAISRWVTYALGALALLAVVFPEYVTFVDAVEAAVLAVVGLVGIEVGKEHKEIKARRKKQGTKY